MEIRYRLFQELPREVWTMSGSGIGASVMDLG
jgi:hypothetical protein